MASTVPRSPSTTWVSPMAMLGSDGNACANAGAGASSEPNVNSTASAAGPNPPHWNGMIETPSHLAPLPGNSADAYPRHVRAGRQPAGFVSQAALDLTLEGPGGAG